MIKKTTILEYKLPVPYLEMIMVGTNKIVRKRKKKT
jgi:hypothetical protein